MIHIAEQVFMKVDEVAAELGVSNSYAYKLIKLISAEISPISAKVTLQLPKLWEGYETLEVFDSQLVGVQLKDGTMLTNIFGPPTQVGYTDIDSLILEMDYSSHQILDPDQVDALIFASNFPWARTLTDSELIVIPIG